jgi:hypothetical protein
MSATKSTTIDGNVVVNGIVEDLSGDGTYKEITAKTQQQSNTQTIIYSMALANDALSSIADICADNKATPDEKITLESQWEQIEAEYPYILSRAVKAGISSSADVYQNYMVAFTNLQTYLQTTPGVLVDLTTTTAIVGGVMRSLFVLYVNKRELVNAAVQNSTPTYSDLQDGYTDAVSGATTVAVRPTLSAAACNQTIYLHWTRQLNLTGKVQIAVYRSDAIDGAYSQIATVSTYSYTDQNLPLDGTADNPINKAFFYKVAYIVNGEMGPLSEIVSAVVTPIPTGSLAAGSITAQKLVSEIINSLIANINSQLTISPSTGYTAGDLSADAPVGTFGAYLDSDEIRLKEKRSDGWKGILSLYLSGLAGTRNARIAFGPNENARFDWDELNDVVVGSKLNTSVSDQGAWAYAASFSTFASSGITAVSSVCDLPSGTRVFLQNGSGYGTSGMVLLFYDKAGALVKTLDLGTSGHAIGNVSKVRAFTNGCLAVIYTDSTDYKFRLLIITPTYKIIGPILICDLHPDGGGYINILTADASCFDLSVTIIYQIDTYLYRTTYSSDGVITSREDLVTDINQIPSNAGGSDAQLSVCHNLAGVEFIAYRNLNKYISIFKRALDGSRTITSTFYQGKGPVIRQLPDGTLLLVYTRCTPTGDENSGYLYADHMTSAGAPISGQYGIKITGTGTDQSQSEPAFTKEICIDYSGALTIYYSSYYGNTLPFIRAAAAAYTFQTTAALNGSIVANYDGTVTRSKLQKLGTGSGVIAVVTSSNGAAVIFGSGLCIQCRVGVTYSAPVLPVDGTDVFFTLPVQFLTALTSWGSLWPSTSWANFRISATKVGTNTVALHVENQSVAQAVSGHIGAIGFVDPTLYE